MNASRSDLFSADCGLVSPLELDLTTPGQGARRIRFDLPYVLLGADPRASLCLDHPAVSWRHVFLQAYGGRLFAVDLEGGGVTLGGGTISAGWVEPGQPLGLGPFVLGHVAPPAEPPGYPGPPLNLVEDRPSPAVPMRLAAFDVFQSDRPLSRWRMSRLLVFVGSSSRCRVRFRDRSVSRLHLVLVATAGGVWAVDLLSRTGMRVNGQPVSWARLEHGDVLEAGVYRLRADYQRRSGMVRTVARAAAAPAASPPEAAGAAGLVPHRFGPAPEGPSPQPHGAEGRAFPPTLILQKERDGGEADFVVPLMQEFSSLQQHMFDKFQQTMVLLVQMLSSMHQEQVALIRDEMRQFQKATEELHRLQEQARVRPSPAPRPDALPEARPAETPSRWQAGAWPGSKPAEPPPAPVPTPAAAREEPQAAGEDVVHSWLNQRIAELEEERQSRWQRLLGFLRRP